jgi:hypothetical protein
MKRRLVTNTSDRLMLIFIEPEGQDYWLRPNEVAEIRAEIKGPDNDFVLRQNEDGLTVWPSPGMGIVTIWAQDVELQCGYQRPSRRA